MTAELKDYIKGFYGIKANTRIFPVTKSFMHNEMDRGCKISGVKRITIHGLRHSNLSLLINMGVPILEASWRAGHTKVDTTLIYTHRNIENDSKVAKELNQKMEVKLCV